VQLAPADAGGSVPQPAGCAQGVPSRVFAPQVAVSLPLPAGRGLRHFATSGAPSVFSPSWGWYTEPFVMGFPGIAGLKLLRDPLLGEVE